jgi:hypothetical protein
MSLKISEKLHRNMWMLTVLGYSRFGASQEDLVSLDTIASAFSPFLLKLYAQTELELQ